MDINREREELRQEVADDLRRLYASIDRQVEAEIRRTSLGARIRRFVTGWRERMKLAKGRRAG